ncbi:MAG TPA: FliM/FliN family flagellar motor switch protein, partial [Deltaproteobacteria bacterium]|nr:FliM/FliN family flagellar motor switch protein [Deltaproteobacteria bacterium]
MAVDEKTGGTLSQEDIDKLVGGGGEPQGGVDQDKLAQEWAEALESGGPIEEGKPLSTAAKKASFTELDETRHAQGSAKELDFILDIPLNLTVEMGRTRMLINDLLQIGQGSVIELN